ncbi:MAG: DUF1385 domain-containing protein [Candidatus Neomarinimicrobiota bacterium]|nr:MAG: DUF1385 domain-containing protein [Candidatus Neomarinimicrobiota bacterium]
MTNKTEEKKTILVGGQAVMEGVMMRTPKAYATAVRNPEGEIITERKEFTSLAKKKKFYAWPVVRGMVSIVESMKIGMETLNFSADIAYPEESKKEAGFWSKAGGFLSTLFAIALAIVMFLLAPMWITEKLFGLQDSAVLFNISAGVFRIIFFLLYLIIISQMKDIKRLFSYHGAEHKTIYAFENGEELTVENIKKHSRFHPRCGTSFLFISMINVIIIYAIVDTLVMHIFDISFLTIQLRLLYHIPLIPLVMGLGYEVLKFSSKNLDKWFIAWIAKPGLWLQRITTKEPDAGMIECAVAALKTGFGDEWEKYKGGQFIAEAIE